MQISYIKHIKNKPKRCVNTVPALTADSKVRISTTQEKETWKDIEPYEGYYQISSHGRVRSWRNGSWGKRKTPKLNVNKRYKLALWKN